MRILKKIKLIFFFEIAGMAVFIATPAYAQLKSVIPIREVQISATLALYQLTQPNITTIDPNNTM